MYQGNADAVRVSLITGLRIGDVLALTRDQIGADGTVQTVCKKTKKPFTGTIPKKLAARLRHGASAAGWVFPSPVPRCHDKHRTRQAVWRDVKRAAKICAVPRNVSPHSARKIYAVEKFKKEGLEEAQNSLQHDRLTTTLIYAFSDQLAAANDNARTKKPPEDVDRAHRARSADDVEQIMTRFFDAFGGREHFAQCVAALIGADD